MTEELWAFQLDRMQREFERRRLAPLSDGELAMLRAYLGRYSLGRESEGSAIGEGAAGKGGREPD
jgi:hypothetical protein